MQVVSFGSASDGVVDGPVHVRFGVAAEAESMAAVILRILPAEQGEVDPLRHSQGSIRWQRPGSALRQQPAVAGRMESAVHCLSFAVPSSLLP